MKHKHILTITLLLLALLIAAGVAVAQNQPPGQPNTLQAADALTFDHFFLFSSDDLVTAPWWQSDTVVDKSGGVHVTFFTDYYIYYAYCPVDCGNPGNWLETAILDNAGEYCSLARPVLALDPAGHPRLMWYKEPNYAYAECNANCTEASNWTEIEILLDPDFVTIYNPSVGHYFALDAQGHPRFVAPAYGGGLLYATCDSGCTALANWHYSQVVDTGELGGLQLAFTGGGQPRVVGIDIASALVYIQCDTSCLVTENWDYVTISPSVAGMVTYPSYSLRLDSQGRPRVAYYRAYADDTLHYAWSNANFTDPAGWSSYAMDLPPASDRTLDLAIDRQDHPHIAYASDNFDLRYLECTAQCETQDSEWTLQDIETGDQLQASDPLPLEAGCWATTWWLDGYPSLALDANDNPHLSYHANHVQYCGTDYDYDAWSIRFALLGSSIPSPTPTATPTLIPGVTPTTSPPVGDNRVYLPAIIR